MSSLKNYLVFSIYLFFCSNLTAQPEIKSTQPFSIGETVEIASSILGEVRKLNIYLPHGYSKDSLKTYPVIYLLDGSADEDFIHIAGLVQFSSFSWIQNIPETIVVGISNIDRKRDFTYPTTNKKDKLDFPTTGGSETFIQFLESELQPFIAKNYNINDNKTIIGQSLGGLIATEILFKKPNLFNQYIIISPSLWWDDESLLTTNPIKGWEDKAVYIGVGKEGPIMERTAAALFKKLTALAPNKKDLFYQYFVQLDHGDTLHLAVYDCFEKMFGKPKE